MELEKQGLFIFGSARSGTTISTKCCNRAAEVYLLEEPNFHLHEHLKDFTAFFNSMHPAMGNCRYKGTYVPPPIDPEEGCLRLLCRLGKLYRYAGEKAAIGPHEYPPNYKQIYLDFHAKYFCGRSTS